MIRRYDPVLGRRALGVGFLVCLLVAVGWGAVAADETIVLGQEDSATLDYETDKAKAWELMKDAASAGQLTSLIQYGNWYGPGWWGGGDNPTSPGDKQPVDELDAIAMRHDFAYQIAEEQGKIHGPAEEMRLKGLADSIAVRDANALPRNPRDWDPPAPDPEQAHEYRRRIGFGFKYESGYYELKSLYDRMKLAGEGDFSALNTSGISEADLDRLAKERGAKWLSGAKVRKLYRIELSPSSDMVDEIGSVQIGVKLHPVYHEGSPRAGGERAGEQDAAGEGRPAISLSVNGYGKLSETTVTADTTVTLSATTKYLGWGDTTGSTITVTAKYDGTDVDVVPAKATFVVARQTFLEVSVEPNLIDTWDPTKTNPCVDVVVTAELTTRGGKPIKDMPLTFARDDGSTFQVHTNASGIATYDAILCKDDVAGELSKMIPFIVTTAANQAGGLGVEGYTLGGTPYLASSRTVSVELRGEETTVVGGRVVDRGRNDRPIEGATVSMTDTHDQQRQVTTGADGSFRFVVSLSSGPYPDLPGNVSAKGYESKSFTATTDGHDYVVGLYPLEATLSGTIVNEETGIGIQGSTVHVTQPFDQILNTSNGKFTLTGLYVGDVVTMRADAQNFRAYVKSGKLTMESAAVTFSLKPGGGEESSNLDITEADEETQKEVAGLSKLYSLMVWASPADPGTFQNVKITAQIFPPQAGVSIEVKMRGTDDYTTSITAMTDAMGKVILPIPGASSGVRDTIIARIVGTSVRQQLRYSF